MAVCVVRQGRRNLALGSAHGLRPCLGRAHGHALAHAYLISRSPRKQGVMGVASIHPFPMPIPHRYIHCELLYHWPGYLSLVSQTRWG